MTCMDLLQAAHTLSGIEMALWDLLGKARSEPVWRLLGYRASLSENRPMPRSFSATTPQETLARPAAPRARSGFRAVKFGWGPFGRGSLHDDADHLDGGARGTRAGRHAAGRCRPDLRRGCRRPPRARLPALEEAGAIWLEEPFAASAYEAYAALAAALAEGRRSPAAKRRTISTWRSISSTTARSASSRSIAAGSAASGRPSGGADYAVGEGRDLCQPHLHVAPGAQPSLQPYAGLGSHRICEYPVR